eukprot:scpid48265/ scgid33468/ 
MHDFSNTRTNSRQTAIADPTRASTSASTTSSMPQSPHQEQQHYADLLDQSELNDVISGLVTGPGTTAAASSGSVFRSAPAYAGASSTAEMTWSSYFEPESQMTHASTNPSQQSFDPISVTAASANPYQAEGLAGWGGSLVGSSALSLDVQQPLDNFGNPTMAQPTTLATSPYAAHLQPQQPVQTSASFLEPLSAAATTEAPTQFTFNPTIANVLASLMQLQAYSTSATSVHQPPVTSPTGISSPASSVDGADSDVPTTKTMVREMLKKRGVTSAAANSNETTKEPDDRHEHTPEEEERLERRRERNKDAATRCRQRQRDRISFLEKQVDGLDDTQEKLRKEHAALLAESERLRAMLSSHKCVKKPKDSKLENESDNGEAGKSKAAEMYDSAEAAVATEFYGDRPGTDVNLSRSISLEDDSNAMIYDNGMET